MLGLGCIYIYILVGGFNPSEKYEFVSWDDSSQYMEKKHVPNHQPDIYIYILRLGVEIGRWFLPIYYITHITMVVVVYPFTTGTPLPSIPILQHRLEGKMALKQPELRTYPVYAAVFTFQSPRLGETSQFVGWTHHHSCITSTILEVGKWWSWFGRVS